MTTSAHTPPVGRADETPDLTFAVGSVTAERFAAVPTLCFGLDIACPGGAPVRSVMLTVCLRVDVARRRYPPAAHRALTEVFGLPETWGSTMTPLHWTRSTLVVPPFEERTTVALPVPCGTDTELAVTKYLRAVDDGDVPLDLLFSGTVFHERAGRLTTARIPWSQQVRHQLPARLWHELVERYYGTSPWVRLPADVHERLDAYRTRHVLADPGEAVRRLLDERDGPLGGQDRPLGGRHQSLGGRDAP